MNTDTFEITAVDIFVLRAPIKVPVRTSFGIMQDRPALLVRVTDRDGLAGWGETWCNFPSCGAEHRGRLIETEIAPLILNREFSEPAEVFRELTASLHLLTLQTGEDGPVAQAIAGIDLALWDLHGRRQGQPLWRMLGGDKPEFPVYASGINPDAAATMAQKKFAEGFRAFKLKVGFDDELDVANVRAIRDTVGFDVALMVDANQGWHLSQALDMVDRLKPFDLRWIEEPLPVDADIDNWRELASASTTALAGGENLRGFDAWRQAIESGVYGYLQPDIAKWGGISACLELARDIRSAGLCYCPHWLGGAVGLMASAHLLAAVGGDGMLEIDSNPNPLRDDLAALAATDTGSWVLDQSNGIGITPDDECLRRYLSQ